MKSIGATLQRTYLTKTAKRNILRHPSELFNIYLKKHMEENHSNFIQVQSIHQFGLTNSQAIGSPVSQQYNNPARSRRFTNFVFIRLTSKALL